MRRHLVGLAVLALVAASCGGSTIDRDDAPRATASGRSTVVSGTSPQETTAATTTPVDDLVFIPPLPDVDPGVLTDIDFSPAGTDWREFVASFPYEAGTGEGMIVELESCHLRAPRRWLYEGTVTLSEGVAEADLGLSLSFLRGDVGFGYPFTATATGTGRFALDLDFDAIAPDPDRPLPESFQCGVHLVAATAPAAALNAYLDPTRSEVPLVWDAPGDSVQALGIGATLTDRLDWRLSWAYHTYAGESLPFAVVWLPPDGGFALGGYDVSSRDGCSQAWFERDAISIVLTRDCDDLWLGDLDDGTPSSLEGWVLTTDYGQLTLGTLRDGVEIRVQARDPDEVGEAALVAVAQQLVAWRNLWYETPPPPDTAHDDLDTAIRQALTDGSWTERGRFELEGQWTVIATRIGPAGETGEAESPPGRIYAQVRTFAFRQIGSGAWVRASDGASSAGSDLCLASFGSGSARGGFSVVFTAEPSWTIQERIDGEWIDVDAVDGFSVTFWETGQDDPPPLRRAVDENGDVVRCSTGGNFLEPGESWSPYRPSDAQRDLPVIVEPAEGLANGDTVTVSGSGFYTETGVVVHQCTAVSVYWDDWFDCIARPDGLGDVRTDASGSFTLEVQLRRRFTTWNGDEVDCRTEECVVRVDSNTGVPRTGWALVEFD